MTRLCFDFDFLIFAAVSIAEERFITATHIPTGRVMEFKTKTEVYGHWKKKEGGWIAAENLKNGNDFWKVEDFEIIEGQRPKPFKVKGVDEFGEPDESKDYFISPWEGAKSVLNKKIRDICEKLGTSHYYGYTGRGKTFREDIATLCQYKGSRVGGMRPLLLNTMKDYVVERHNGIMVTDLEADDMCNIDTTNAYLKWKKSSNDEDKVIQVTEDKDAKGCQGFHFNPNKDKDVRLIEGIGSLWLDKKGDVDGAGRMWMYYQIASEDNADEYYANVCSDIPWGAKSAYKMLKDCKTDKEAFQALVDTYKILYPEPKTVVLWRGDEREIDWLYVLQENFNLAKMLRSVDEKPTIVKDVLDKLDINY